MKLQDAPVFEWGGRIIEIVVDAMKLLRECPDHQQVPDWRREISTCRQNAPEAHAMAQLMLAQEFAARDAVRENPAACGWCSGSGRVTWPGAHCESFCSCPLGEAMERGRSLAEDSFDRGITDHLVDPEEQMLLSWGTS